jgi:hypothetical protein
MEGEARVRQLLLARAALAVIGVVVWGYGYRIDDPNVRLAAIVILAVALLLRFVPKRWVGGKEPRDE